MQNKSIVVLAIFYFLVAIVSGQEDLLGKSAMLIDKNPMIIKESFDSQLRNLSPENVMRLHEHGDHYVNSNPQNSNK